MSAFIHVSSVGVCVCGSVCVCVCLCVCVWTLCTRTCWHLSIWFDSVYSGKSHDPRQLDLAGNSTGPHSADFGDHTISTRFKLSCLPLHTTQHMQLITLKYTLYIRTSVTHNHRTTSLLLARIEGIIHMPFASHVFIFGFELKLS